MERERNEWKERETFPRIELTEREREREIRRERKNERKRVATKKDNVQCRFVNIN